MTVDCSRGARHGGFLAAAVCGLALILAGCHGSTIELPGTPVLSMGGFNSTPNADFANYVIAIDAITLTANDGSIVEPLSTPETVDLVKLSNMAELVQAPAVPEGTYISMQITLDYSAASIYINDGAEKSVVATAVDTTGDLMESATITITFDPANPLVVTNNASSLARLDIDLAAFNSIDHSTSTVTVQPFAVMTPSTSLSTVMRVRGDLVVTQPPGAYIINVRPFYDLESELGAVTVNVTDTTYYNVNGITYTGSAGLSALAALPINSAVAAYGTLADLSTITPTFNATAVYGGASLESPLLDYFTGSVSERSGNTISLRGVSYQSPLGYTYVYPVATATIDDTVIVSEDGVAAAKPTLADISAGSLITISGTASVSTTNLLTMDATDGQVRLQPSQFVGTVQSTSANGLEAAWGSLNNWASDAYIFTGATTPAVNPKAYQINTGSLSLAGLAAGDLVQVSGMVAPYGSAPPNFIASSLIPTADLQQQLVIEWTDGGVYKPFTSATSAGLVVNLADPAINASQAFIRTGQTTVPLSTLAASPLITVTGAQGQLLFAIGSDTATDGVQIYNSYAPFLNYVVSNLGAKNTTDKIYRLVAYGHYNSASNTFVVTRIYVALQETTAVA